MTVRRITFVTGAPRPRPSPKVSRPLDTGLKSLGEVDTGNIMHRMNSSEVSGKACATELQEIEKAVDELRQQISNLKKENLSLTCKILELTDQNRDLNFSLSHYQKTATEAQGDAEESRCVRDGLEHRIQEMDAENDQLAEERDTLQAKLIASETQCYTLEKQIEDLRLQRESAKIDVPLEFKASIVSLREKLGLPQTQ
jgi:chromosome segregation ATPase